MLSLSSPSLSSCPDYSSRYLDSMPRTSWEGSGGSEKQTVCKLSWFVFPKPPGDRAPFGSTFPQCAAYPPSVPSDPLSTLLQPDLCPWRLLVMNCITDPSCLLASAWIWPVGGTDMILRDASQWLLVWT